jgi:tetratricopeptide (TPR) repeat protein
MAWVRRGLNVLAGIETDAANRQRASLLAWYAYYLQQEGRHAQAMRWCHLAMAQADESGDLEAMALACKVLDWGAMDLGTLQEPVNAHRALELYQQLGDLPGQASILNMLGAFEFWRGRWNEALTLYERAGETVKRTGNTVMHAYCLNNIGEILAEQGREDEAEVLFREASLVWQSAGHRSGFAYIKSNLARVAAHAGRFDEALALFEEARSESDQLDADPDTVETDARVAEYWLLRGDAERALELAGEALRTAAGLGGTAPQTSMLQRIRG